MNDADRTICEFHEPDEACVHCLADEVERLREWIDTVGRECPSNTAIDAFLAAANSEEKGS